MAESLEMVLIRPLPSFFPIKGMEKAIGFFWVERVKASSQDYYQLLGEFIGILLNNSMLHRQVEE